MSTEELLEEIACDASTVIKIMILYNTSPRNSMMLDIAMIRLDSGKRALVI